MSDSMPRTQSPPENATAALILVDGSVFWGQGVGAEGNAVGEVCFNTSLTGYQEIMTDPSYAGQIITFTFPHIGNVGTNDEDFETTAPAARGCVLRADITASSVSRSCAINCLATATRFGIRSYRILQATLISANPLLASSSHFTSLL